MLLTTVTFYLLAAICVAGAVATVTLSNPVSCALALIACMTGLAGLFAQLSAGYVAVLQLLIYAGAIMVLFLFVVMLLNLSPEELSEGRSGVQAALKALVAVAFLVDVWVFLDAGLGRSGFASLPGPFGTMAQVGESIFTRHLAAFELTSLLLTVAVVGVVLITRRQKAAERR